MSEAQQLLSVAELLDTLGVSALSRTLRHANASTVSSWKLRGRIPVEYWRAIIDAAQDRGLSLDADGLLGLHAPANAAADDEPAANEVAA